MAITKVGTSLGANNTSVASVSVSRAAGSTGNLFIIGAEANGNGALTIADTQTNTWVPITADHWDATNSLRTASWYCLAKNTTSTTVTITGSGIFASITLDEFTGHAATTPLDQSSRSADGASGTPTGAALTPSVNDCLVWAYCVDSVTAVGNIDGSAATKGGDDGAQDWSEYRILTGRSGVSMTAAFTGSGAYCVMTATFKPATGASGITLRQQTATITPSFSATGKTSTTVGYTSAIQAGSLLTGVIALGSSATSVSTLADSCGNVWLLGRRQESTAGSSARLDLWYARNAVGTTNTVTITLASTCAGTHQIGFHEWTGASTETDVLSTSNSTRAASSLHGTGGGLTASSLELVIAAWRSLTTFSSGVQPTGYSSIAPNGTFTNAVYKVMGGVSSAEDPIWQVGASTIAHGLIVTFRASTGTGGGGGGTYSVWFGLPMMGVS